MNGQVEVIWKTFKNIAHSSMVYTRVNEEYIHLSLKYTADHIFTVLPIKHLVNQYGEPTTIKKLETVTTTSVSNLIVVLFPCVVQKATAHVDKKALNTCHQSQKGFCGILVGIPQHKKG